MLTKEKQKAIIEAMLFVSEQPLSVGKIVRKLKKAARLASEEQIEEEKTNNDAISRSGRPCDDALKDILVASEDQRGDDDTANDNEVNPDQDDTSNEEEPDVIEIDSLEIDDEADNDNEVLAVEEGDEEDIMKQLMQKQEELDQEISHTDVKILLKEIQEELLKDDRGVELVTVAKGYQLRTKYEISLYLKDEKVQTPSRFSPSALEALAIVAYQQPITRQKIEDVRGVDSGGVLKTLLDKGILRVVGRSDEPGKPLVYGTSKKFLEIFSLKGIRDLPNLQDYHSLQLSQDQEELETTYHQTDEIHVDDLVEEDYSDLSEAEQAVLDDLNQSMKDLRKVEKKVVAAQKTENSEQMEEGSTSAKATADKEGKKEEGDSETVGLGDLETGGQGDLETRGQGDLETRGQGDLETRGQGDREQGTGDREQGTGDREQGTGDREQGTGDSE